MNGLLLLYCILGALLSGIEISIKSVDSQSITVSSNGTEASQTIGDVIQSTDTSSQLPTTTTTTSPRTTATSPSTTASTTTPKTIATSTIASTTAIHPLSMFYKKECLLISFVSAGLILASTIMLVSTLLLVCKVCRLNRRIKALSSNADLISKTEYRLGTANRDKDKSEVTEVKETSMLMADVNQAQEEMANGTTKEEGGTVKEDGQVGEENKKKEEGDAAKSEDVSATPATVAEAAATSKPQEEAADDESSKAVAASSSEGTEERMDVV